MPNRIIRESCRTSPTLDQLSDGAERLFWRLTTVADDFGRFERDPRVLLASCFPLKVNSLPVETVKTWFDELVSCCLVTTYVVNSKHLAFFNTWSVYQRKRALYPKYPEPPPADIGGHLTTYDNIGGEMLPSAAIGGHLRPRSEKRDSEEARSEEARDERESEGEDNVDQSAQSKQPTEQQTNQEAERIERKRLMKEAGLKDPDEEEEDE